MLKSRAVRATNLPTVYWLIEKYEAGPTEVLILRLENGREALPVFSWAEEAKMFLRFGGFEENGWTTRESAAGELVSMLEEEPHAGVGFVALDPMPEMVTPMFAMMMAFVTWDRQSFIDCHIGKEHSLAR